MKSFLILIAAAVITYALLSCSEDKPEVWYDDSTGVPYDPRDPAHGSPMGM